MSWQWKGKPGLLQSMWPQSVDHDWATELNWPCSDQQVRSYHLTLSEKELAFREKITKGKLKWGKDERFRRALLEVQGYLNTVSYAEMRSRTWRLMAALFLMCSKQTSWAYRGQFPVCPKHYYSSQRVLKSITSKEMVSPAEFSKASFFTAINRSSSNSSESKGDEKGVLDKEWQAPCSLQRARCFQGPHCPVCSWLSVADFQLVR